MENHPSRNWKRNQSPEVFSLESIFPNINVIGNDSTKQYL